jgi:pimeloyl-ACP methyl ester carboxylesterase
LNQASIQAEILAGLARLLRNGEYTGQVGKAESIVLVGHSSGSVTSSNVINKYPSEVDAVVLTGIAYSTISYGLKILFEAFAPRIASQLYPSCFGELDTGYLTFADIYAHVNTFFKAPFELEAVKYAQSIVQPFALSEWLSLAPGLSSPLAPEFKGPVYVTTGQFDFAACGGECYSTFAEAESHINVIFPKTRLLESAVHPGAGHGINFGLNATGSYSAIIGFLEKAGF